MPCLPEEYEITGTKPQDSTKQNESKVSLCGDVIQVGSPYDDVMKQKNKLREHSNSYQGQSYCYVGATGRRGVDGHLLKPAVAESDIDYCKYSVPYAALPGIQCSNHASVAKRLSGSFQSPTTHTDI